MFRHTLSVDPSEQLSQDFADPVTDSGYESDEEAAAAATASLSGEEAALWNLVDPQQRLIFVLDGPAAQTLRVKRTGNLERQVVNIHRLPLERAPTVATSLLAATRPQHLVVALRTIEPHQAAAILTSTPYPSLSNVENASQVLVLANDLVQIDDPLLRPLWSDEGTQQNRIQLRWVEPGCIGGITAALLASGCWLRIPALALLAVEDDDGPSPATLEALLLAAERFGCFTRAEWEIRIPNLRQLLAKRQLLYI